MMTKIRSNKEHTAITATIDPATTAVGTLSSLSSSSPLAIGVSTEKYTRVYIQLIIIHLYDLPRQITNNQIRR